MLSDTATASATTASSSRFSGAITVQNSSLNNLPTIPGTSTAGVAVAAAAAAAAAVATAHTNPTTVIVTSGSAGSTAAATTHANYVSAAAAVATIASTSSQSTIGCGSLSSAAISSAAPTTTQPQQQLELPIRLRLISGFQTRVNDVIYCPPLVQHDEEPTTVVYFGGDVQDFSENMETSRDSKSYIKFNLDATAMLLRQDFPKSHIALIRPARMEFKTFSCFDNFVRGNNAGVPDHTPMHHALQHMEKLLQNTALRLLGIFSAGRHSNGNNGIDSSSGGGASTSNNSNIHSQHAQQPQFDLQDMDIDILQVQETVTVDTNGTVIESTTTINDDRTTGDNATAAQLSTDSIGKNGDATHTDDENHSPTATDICFTTSAKNKVEPIDAEAPWWLKDIPKLDKCKLILVGFSKGCVVLNQFIYEFHYLKTLTPDDVIATRLLTRIVEMYWLDGGHGGAKNTWITSRSLLETLTRLGIQIHVHVTPYQVQDERRPWIRREEKTFVDLLRRLGASLQRYLHFETAPANLFTHFEVLQVFRQACPSQPAAHISPTFDDDDDEK